MPPRSVVDRKMMIRMGATTFLNKQLINEKVSEDSYYSCIYIFVKSFYPYEFNPEAKHSGFLSI